MPGLYRGVFAYSCTFLGQYTISMTLFELIIDHIVKKHGLKAYQNNERSYTILAAVGSGIFGSLMTNCFEVIVIRQQGESGETVR